ncbi:MAG: hypothetical protein ACR2H5_18220, partial [Ktedonobacteraceae bacterium]
LCLGETIVVKAKVFSGGCDLLNLTATRKNFRKLLKENFWRCFVTNVQQKTSIYVYATFYRF